MPTIPSEGDASSKRKRSEAQLSVSLPASDSSALPAATSSKDSADTVMASAAPEETGEPRWLQLQNRVNQQFEDMNLPQRYDLSSLAEDKKLDLIQMFFDLGHFNYVPKVLTNMGIYPLKRPTTGPAFYEQPFIQNTIYSDLLEYIETVGTRSYYGLGETFYARVLPIVQSSGTGKSRAMYEAARKHFSFFMVLRDPSSHDTSFPPSDNALFSLLCRQANLSELTERFRINLSDAAIFRVLSLFLAMVDECLEWLERPGAKDLPMRLNTPEGWHTELLGKNQGHVKFYEQVAERTRRLEKEFMNTDKSGVTVYSDLITRFKKGLGNLSNSLNLLQGAKTIVFYIDEGHELSEGVTISLLQTAFSALQEKGCSTPHAVVLGSTTSKVAIAAPPRAARGQTSSARFRDTSSDPFVLPWCALPVNLHLQPSDLSSLPEPPEGTKQVSKQYQRPSLRPLPPAKELRGIKTQLKIGRPLWYSCYEAEDCNPSPALDKAISKLTGTYDESSPADGLRAAVICRLALEPSHTGIGRELASELVSHRMARALFIPSDRTYIEAAYVVEPVLGYAASISMRNDTAAWVEQLLQLTESCLIQKGSGGELLTKLAFTLAFDAASPDMPPDKVTTRLFESAFLKDFFAHLGNIDVAKLMTCQAWDPSGKAKTFADISTATCVLSQFVKAVGGAGEMTGYAINQSIVTSTFIETPPHIDDIDILAAFVIDESKLLEPSNIVLVVAQTNNYKSPIKHVTPSLDPYRERGYTVVHILHEVFETECFSFTVKEMPKSSNPSENTDNTKGSLFSCTLVGINPAHADETVCESIATGERERYGLRGIAAAHADAQMTTLVNEFDYPIAEAVLGFDLGGDWGAQGGSVPVDHE